MRNATLVYVFDGEKLLLGMKKKGFGAGRWNGIGGKINPGESPEQAAQREVREEIGVQIEVDKPLGSIIFRNSSKGDWTVHVFAVDRHEGQPRESEEMRPQWFPIGEMPYEQMWDDDKLWYEHLFARQPFKAEFWFGPNEIVDRHEITLL